MFYIKTTPRGSNFICILTLTSVKDKRYETKVRCNKEEANTTGGRWEQLGWEQYRAAWNYLEVALPALPFGI